MNTTINFDPEKFTLIIPVHDVQHALDPIMDVIEVNGFRIKNEFHITLVGFARGRDIKALIERNGKNLSQVQSEIEQLLNESLITPEIIHEWYYLSKDVVFTGKPSEYRESIIAMVMIPEIEQFWNKLQECVGGPITPPFLHITLATRGTGSEQAWEGIGIKDVKDFETLTKQKIER